VTTTPAIHVFVCENLKGGGGKCCGTSKVGARGRLKALIESDFVRHGGNVRVSRSGCIGACGSGPALVFYPAGRWYTYTSEDDINIIYSAELLSKDAADHLRIDRKLSLIDSPTGS
jgi:(2Fe-2S) ferredoxin